MGEKQDQGPYENHKVETKEEDTGRIVSNTCYGTPGEGAHGHVRVDTETERILGHREPSGAKGTEEWDDE